MLEELGWPWVMISKFFLKIHHATLVGKQGFTKR
jgi:hypothetical protein